MRVTRVREIAKKGETRSSTEVKALTSLIGTQGNILFFLMTTKAKAKSTVQCIFHNPVEKEAIEKEFFQSIVPSRL